MCVVLCCAVLWYVDCKVGQHGLIVALKGKYGAAAKKKAVREWVETIGMT